MSNWNGKVRCFKNGFNFTKGNIYEITNGVITNDCGTKYPYSQNRNEDVYRYKDLDDLCEDISPIFEEVELPKLCEILGVDIGEKFTIKHGDGYIYGEYYVGDDGYLKNRGLDCSIEALTSLINEEWEVIKQNFYEFNEEEIITLKGLWINDYQYIARDKNGDLCAWDRKPKQLEDEYDYGEANCFASLDYDLFKNVEFGTLLNISHELSKIN